MYNSDKNFSCRGFSTPRSSFKSMDFPTPRMPMSEKKRSSPFHVIHKVPSGDSPYVKAKQVQLIAKDPSKAISLFWAAINAGDRVDSSLKDMAIVMKQLDRSDEAIEAIKSFRHLCAADSQESLDNVLVELYKRSGRVEEEVEMLEYKLKHIEEGTAFGGRRTKMARSQGKKVQITLEQERSRILGNLAWAYLQLNNYELAEEYYRKALSMAIDKNKQCNLAICLMHMNKLAESRALLQAVRASSRGKQMDESFAKSFERASQMLAVMESRSTEKLIGQSSCLAAGNVGAKVREKYMEFENEDENLKRDQLRKRGFTGEFAETESVALPRNLDVTYTQPRNSPRGPQRFERNRIGEFAETESVALPRNLDVTYTQPRNSPRGPQRFERIDENLHRNLTREMEAVSSTYQRSYSSPPPAKNYLQIPFTQPKRSSWSSGRNYHQRRGTWRNDANNGCSNEKLAFDHLVSNDDGGECCRRELTKSCSNPEFTSNYPGAVVSFIDREKNQIFESAISGEFNQQTKPDSLTYRIKKSWADMAEEEEEEGYEEFNDENLNLNFHLLRQNQSPRSNQIEDKIQQKLEQLDLKDEDLPSGNALSWRNSTARRSLQFEDEKPQNLGSSQPKKDSTEEINDCAEESGRKDDTISGGIVKLMRRRHRLQVFEDITVQKENP